MGTRTNNQWYSAYGSPANQRFHIDLSTAKIIKRIYYENSHNSGVYTIVGVKDFTLWGSNDDVAFADLIYEHDTNWTQLITAQSAFDQHVSADKADPKYILVTNTMAYRYYALKFANNFGDVNAMGIRRIELQTETEVSAVLVMTKTCVYKVTNVDSEVLKKISKVMN
jgi:hypothetical protein